MGLFDLDMFNESSNDDDILDLSLDESAEDFNIDDDDDEALLEATRYNLEFEKALDNYKKAWNEHKKYIEKASTFYDNESNDGNTHKDKVKNKNIKKELNAMLKRKSTELENLRKQLVKNYESVSCRLKNGDICPIGAALQNIDDDPNDLTSAYKIGNIGRKEDDTGRIIRDNEKNNRVLHHGPDKKDKIGDRKPGRYNFKESGEDFDLDDMFDESSNEFAPGSNATNDVDNGDKDAKISVPGKIELTSDTYNKAISALKQSFKESIDVLSMLENANIIQKTQEEVNAEILESVMMEAAYNAMVDGPIFEAVDRSDKKSVKEIVKNFGPKFKKYIGEKDFEFFKPTILTKLGKFWSTRLWQTVGILVCEDSYVEKTINTFNKTYKDDLGDYRFIAVKISAVNNMLKSKLFVYDAIRIVLARRFGYKNHANAYMILVDKELTAEIEKDVKKVSDAIESSQKSEELKNNDSNNDSDK